MMDRRPPERGDTLQGAPNEDLVPGRAEYPAVVLGTNGWRIQASTAAVYADRTNRLWKAAEIELTKGDPEALLVVTPTMVVEHLARRRPGIGQPEGQRLSEKSWGSYRGALLWVFSQKPHIIEYAMAVRMLETLRYSDEADVEELKAARKRLRASHKGIPIPDFKQLLDELAGMNRTVGWGSRVQFWLHAGFASGLRPGEWTDVRWADQDLKNTLLVNTSKGKADLPPAARAKARALAAEQGLDPMSVHKPLKIQQRAVPIDPADQRWVELHLDSIAEARESGIDFAHYFEYCRQYLHRACRRIWGNSKCYSLNDARHQYAANQKRVLPPDEVARRMGHTTAQSTNRRYAAPRHAHKGRTEAQANKAGQVDQAMDQPGEEPSSGQDPGDQARSPQAAPGRGGAQAP